jgi:hypothetical protein
VSVGGGKGEGGVNMGRRRCEKGFRFSFVLICWMFLV